MRASIRQGSNARTYITALVAVVLFTCLYINLSYIPKISTQQQEVAEVAVEEPVAQQHKSNVKFISKSSPPPDERKKEKEKEEHKVEKQQNEEEKPQIVRALIESCSGWKLNALPKLKAFVTKEAEHYENLKVNFIPGADPKIMFYDAQDNKVEEMTISHMDTPSLDELLTSKGFKKKKI